MGQPKTYQGGCQCGRVRYQVELDLEQPVLSCNCSMCGRAGTLLTFVPAEKFKLVSGEGAVTDYQFKHLVIHHLFCSTCGIKSFSRGAGRDGGEQIAINARCLDDVDLDALTIQKWDGRSR
ncbi:MAG TPA: GFA family protein [Polyangia bacterium]